MKYKDLIVEFLKKIFPEDTNKICINKDLPEDLKPLVLRLNKDLYNYMNSIKKDKGIDLQEEYSNLYLYFVEVLENFYMRRCKEDVDLFNSYLNNMKNKVETKNKEYDFSFWLYLSIKRKIINGNVDVSNENKDKISLQGFDNNGDDGKFGSKSDRFCVENGLYYSLGSDSIIDEIDGRGTAKEKNIEEVIKDNKKSLRGIRRRLKSAGVTEKQCTFLMITFLGVDIDKGDNFVDGIEYTKEQKSQFIRQIEKRLNREIRPYLNDYYNAIREERIQNKKPIQKPTQRDLTDYVGKTPDYLKDLIKKKIIINS